MSKNQNNLLKVLGGIRVEYANGVVDTAQDFPKARERLEDLKRSGKSGPRARERISRSKIEKQQEGECSVM